LKKQETLRVTKDCFHWERRGSRGLAKQGLGTSEKVKRAEGRRKLGTGAPDQSRSCREKKDKFTVRVEEEEREGRKRTIRDESDWIGTLGGIHGVSNAGLTR